MATNNYTALIEHLKRIPKSNSENENRRGYSEARNLINSAQLVADQKETILAALHKAADTNQGYYYNSNGVNGAITALESLQAANDDNYQPEPPTTLTVAQLVEKVSNGRIFSVQFTKRTTGETRSMTCRLGVEKFLRGGKLAYSPAEKQLLTVFSMRDKGYRMIPFEGVQRVSVGGQQYQMAGV